MGDTSNATRRFRWTGLVFPDTVLTLPTGCVSEEESRCCTDTDVVPASKAGKGAGGICWWELGSHSVLQTPCGKGCCSTPHRERTHAPSLQEHQEHGPSLFTGCCCPVLTLWAPGAWMEPAGLLSLSRLLQRGSWSTCCHHYPCGDISLSLLMLTPHWETKDGDWPAGSSQLQENAISQPRAHHDFSCPVTARRLAVCFWKEGALGSVAFSTTCSTSD